VATRHDHASGREAVGPVEAPPTASAVTGRRPDEAVASDLGDPGYHCSDPPDRPFGCDHSGV